MSASTRESDLIEFEILWLDWDWPHVFDRTTVRKHSLSEAITTAADLMRKGKGGSDGAHGLYVRRKED